MDVIPCINKWNVENVEGDNESVDLNDAPNSNEDNEHLVKVERKVVRKMMFSSSHL